MTKKKAQPKVVQYATTWRNKWLTSEAATIEEMVEGLRAAANVLAEMAKDGVKLDSDDGVADDYARLVTTDPVIGKKHRMEPDDFDEEDNPDPN